MKSTREVYESMHRVYIPGTSGLEALKNTRTTRRVKEGGQVQECQTSRLYIVTYVIYILGKHVTRVNTNHYIPKRPEITPSLSHTLTSTHGTRVRRESMKTLYTQVMTTRKCANVGNLLETHGTLDTSPTMIAAVSGISLARGDARGTTGSDGLAEHLERMNDFLHFHVFT